MSVQVITHHVQKRYVILDIDGCCIDSSKRLPLLMAGDREAYDAAHHTDTTIPHGVELYRSLMERYIAFFVTSRLENAREYTLAQLTKAFGPDNERHVSRLLMRPIGMDGVADEILKPMLLEQAQIPLDQVVMAVDDRTSMVNYWRSVGVPCIQPVADTGLHIPNGFTVAEAAKKASTEFPRGRLLRHKDGGYYRILDSGRSTVDQSELIRYEHVWPFHADLPWLRPAKEFTYDRFTPVYQSELDEAMKQDRIEAQLAVTRAKEARKAAEAKT